MNYRGEKMLLINLEETGKIKNNKQKNSENRQMNYKMKMIN